MIMDQIIISLLQSYCKVVVFYKEFVAKRKHVSSSVHFFSLLAYFCSCRVCTRIGMHPSMHWVTGRQTLEMVRKSIAVHILYIHPNKLLKETHTHRTFRLQDTQEWFLCTTCTHIERQNKGQDYLLAKLQKVASLMVEWQRFHPPYSVYDYNNNCNLQQCSWQIHIKK